MARRFPVVVSQSPVSNPQRRDLEESLVGALLMERGIDVNVIPHLADLESGETGLLCLEGITGAMAVIGWMEPAPAHELLGSHGINGRRGRSMFDAAPASGMPGERAIYFVDLTRGPDVTAVVAELRRIRDDLGTPTVSLGLGAASAAPARAGEPPSRPAAPLPETTPAAKPAAVESPAPQAAPPSAEGSSTELDDDHDEALDRLIDQLADLDL